MNIVLASESPFRKRAMDLVGVVYETCPAAIDEKAIRHDDAFALTRTLAEAKARKVAESYPEAVIVAGDAVGALRGKIFEKPRDLDEAAQFLRELSGNEFQFVTAIAVLHAAKQKMLSAVEVSNILFRQLRESEIQKYIREYPVLNFAGAFEDHAVLKFADRVSGSPNIGTAMPVSRLTAMLREQGVEI
ncbi:MAG TPA: Maf family nucleotide pyrophosphatase [Terriglobales bacterium]|nr:Maf family nucleotide pyrophosphatase [Terriglobales bacterium]